MEKLTQRLSQEDPQKNHIVTQAVEDIIQNVKQSLEQYDLFASLVNQAVWQSHAEMTSLWIHRYMSNEWEEIQNHPDDTVDMRRLKHVLKHDIFQCLRSILVSLSSNPTIIQRFSTRFLVRKALVSTLPVHDQDRILASELLLKYNELLALLTLMSQLDIDYEKVYLKPSSQSITENGDILHSFSLIGTTNYPMVKRDFPDLTVQYIQNKELGIFTELITIPQKLIESYTSAIGDPKEQNVVRHELIQNLEISAWKKWGTGNTGDTEKFFGFRPVLERM